MASRPWPVERDYTEQELRELDSEALAALAEYETQQQALADDLERIDYAPELDQYQGESAWGYEQHRGRGSEPGQP